MPSTSGQGQSELVTEAKVRGLSYSFAINLTIFANKFANTRYRYWHFDLNAGSGFNDKVGCVGSPIAFLAQARECGVERFFAAFCDHDPHAVKALMLRPEVANDLRAHVIDGDNASLLEAIPSIIADRGENTAFALGSVLSDDNATGIPVAGLAKLAVSCPRLDIIIHWNSTGFKRVFGRYPEHHLLPLPDVVEAIGKPNWWIKEPASSIHGFTMLVGRGVDIAPPRHLGFHKLNSPRGMDVLERCSYSDKEQRRRGPKQEAMF